MGHRRWSSGPGEERPGTGVALRVRLLKPPPDRPHREMSVVDDVLLDQVVDEVAAAVEEAVVVEVAVIALP